MHGLFEPRDLFQLRQQGSRRQDLEGTAADGVGFVLVLFMAGSQGQLVNEVESTAHLLALRVFAVPVLLIHLADVIHMILYNRTSGVTPASQYQLCLWPLNSVQPSRTAK